MTPTFEERLEQFHRGVLEQTRRAGVSAYILHEDGSVLRISPDGKRDLIVAQHGLRHAQPGEGAEQRR
ncbi:hypothetical protein FQV39_05715 [Bosea sp. F3-2]|uniref:hypothetical protein n=1 Tax=Bosea sp. F3-2 TaxID=2599640 RepID=UPI0011EDA205|nr:hypothetical protein [Bosea sp. F3-2]QEL22115.1 hypothetical protein FQV39_05715 [Bosea sp. F3-2]